MKINIKPKYFDAIKVGIQKVLISDETLFAEQTLVCDETGKKIEIYIHSAIIFSKDYDDEGNFLEVKKIINCIKKEPWFDKSLEKLIKEKKYFYLLFFVVKKCE